MKRRIIFYRWTTETEPSRFPHGFLEDIDNAEETPVLETGDDTTAIIPIDFQETSRVAQMQLLALRGDTRLPAKWRRAAPLESIDLLTGEYSADVSHVAIWPDGVAAQDFYREAPRLGRLTRFVRQQCGTRVIFSSLYNADMFERLENLRGQLRSVHLTFRRADMVDTDARPGAFSELLPAVFGERVPSVHVALGMGRFGPRDRYLDQHIEDAVFDIAENARDQVDSLVIGGISSSTGKAERVNLLSERIQQEVEVAAEDGIPSIPRRHDIFLALNEARQELDRTGAIQRAIEAQVELR